MKRWRVTAFFEPRDLWIGVYWTWGEPGADGRDLRIYICLLPCLPVVFVRAAS